MIQRIQSIWLFICTVCIFLTFKLPFYSGTNAKGEASYQLNATENILLTILTVVAGALAFAIIFLYKQRPLQLKLCMLGVLLQVLLVFLYYRETTNFTVGTYALWALLHIVAMICFLLAARGINKDEKIIKDSDRLR